jgi:OPT oligopeptide transporter protein
MVDCCQHWLLHHILLLVSPPYSLCWSSNLLCLCSSHLIICVQYSNVWYSAYLPLVSSQAFDNTGSVYNLSRVITPDGSFDLDGYQGYSPLFLPLSFVIFYGLSFASYTALLVHTLLYNSKQIWTHAFCTVQPDIHVRLMSIYKEVPGWWYFSILGACIEPKRAYVITFFAVITFAFGVVAIELWDTQLPVWAFVLSVIICELVASE